MTDRPFRVLPRVTDQNEHFWRGGADGELRFLRCQDCGYWIHPPAPICPECLSKDVAAEPVSGDAVVHTTYQAGLRMPADVSVIGYTASAEPDFTCIKVPLNAIGRLATENLIKLLNGEKHLVSLPDQKMAVELVDMGSTAPPAD